MRKLGNFDPHHHTLVLDEQCMTEVVEQAGKEFDPTWTGMLVSRDSDETVTSLWVTAASTPYSLHSEYEQVV